MSCDTHAFYPRHSALDDAYGLFTGIALAATGIAILGKSGLITGGIAGMALLASFVTPYPSSILVPAINVPFLLFALFTMGRNFTLKSVLVSFALGLGVKLVTPALNVAGIDPAVGWALGGTLLGMGILCLARHNASMGGTGSMVLWFQRKFGVNSRRGATRLRCGAVPGRGLLPARRQNGLVGGRHRRNEPGADPLAQAWPVSGLI